MDLIQQFPHTQSYTIDGNKEAVLMIHGFTATPALFYPLAQRLTKLLGWEIRAPLLPGHGLTFEKMDEVSHKVWLKFSEEEFQKLASRFSKIHLIGHSMGGTLCAYLATKHPDQVTSVTLLAPAMYVREWWNRFLIPLVHCLPTSIRKKWIIHKPNSKNTDPVSYLRYSAQAVIQMNDIFRLVYSNVKITCPCLIFRPIFDQTIHTKSSQWFYDHAHGQKKIIDLEKSPHVVFLGEENEKIYSEIEAFLKQFS